MKYQGLSWNLWNKSESYGPKEVKGRRPRRKPRHQIKIDMIKSLKWLEKMKAETAKRFNNA